MQTSGSAAGARRRPGPRLGVTGAVLAFLALTTVQAVGVNPYLPPDELMVAWYDGNGGRTHARYLLPVIGVAAVLAALGLDALPGARRGLVTW
jgi:hypothetical protein